MNIKKMFYLFLSLIVVYLLFQVILKFTSHGHVVNYDLKAEDIKLEIKEVYTRNEKNEENNYYFEIKDKNNTFTFQIFDDLKQRNYVIKEIAYLQGENYTCIYPTFKTKEQLTDILCMKNDIIYPYQTIKGTDEEVDSFKEALKEIYDEGKYQNDLSDTLKKESITIYRKNILSSHFLAVENYKGLYLINTKDIYKKVELLENDQYKKEVTTFYQDKYITADYNQMYTFNEFYVVDIKNGKQSKIISNTSLNLDAYVMGTIDSKVFVYDRSNKEQYSVNLKNNSISKVGNTSSGIQIYENKTWHDFSSYDAYKEKVLFHEYKIKDEKWSQYARVDKIGNQLSGYYYFYEKKNNKYRVYQAPIQNENSKTYLFDTTNLENIVYQEGFIYFMNGTDLCYYNNNTATRTILTNKEFEFNQTLKFGLFIS